MSYPPIPPNLEHHIEAAMNYVDDNLGLFIGRAIRASICEVAWLKEAERLKTTDPYIPHPVSTSGWTGDGPEPLPSGKVQIGIQVNARAARANAAAWREWGEK